MSSLTSWLIVALATIVVGSALAAPGLTATPPERRFALVIGNNNYRHIESLQTAINDSRAMARELQSLGFAVQAYENLDRRQMNDAIAAFIDRTSNGSVALFFYAGHGVQIQSHNYLLPIDINASRAEHAVQDGVDLGGVIDRLAAAKAKLSVFVIDACRNNPYQRTGTRSIGSTRGLALTEAPNGFLVIFSAGANQQALDRLGAHDKNPNGLFVRELLPVLRQPGLRIDDAVKRVRQSVLQKARSVGHEQMPAIYDQVDGDFYLNTAPVEAKQNAGLVALDIDLVATRNANIRQQPSVNSGLVAKLARGTEVTGIGRVTNDGKDWYRIQQAGQAIGYVLAELLSEVEAPQIVPPDSGPPRTAVFPPTHAAQGFAANPAPPTLLGQPAPRLAFASPPSTPTPGPALVAPVPAIKRNSLGSPFSGPFAPGKDFQDCATCPALIVVPEGDYVMGDDFNGPKHHVKTRSFAIGRFEVSFEEYDACVEGGGCSHRASDMGWGRGKQPVVDVSWHDAKEYVAWLSASTGARYRLPSEAEWEYAARAGSAQRFSTGVDLPDGAAHCYNCAGKYDYTRPAPIGSYPPNDFGLHDVHGNVGEWTEDCYNGSYDKAPTDGTAWVQGDCSYRMKRGGSWWNYQKDIRSAYRGTEKADKRDNRIGLRVLRDILN